MSCRDKDVVLQDNYNHAPKSYVPTKLLKCGANITKIPDKIQCLLIFKMQSETYQFKKHNYF